MRSGAWLPRLDVRAVRTLRRLSARCEYGAGDKCLHPLGAEVLRLVDDGELRDESEGDTAFVIEEGLTIAGKPLKDHHEAVGHARAIDLMMTWIARGKRRVGNSPRPATSWGARRCGMLAQFLLEALVVSVIGCLIDVLLRVGCAWLVSQSFAVGVFLGFQPARPR